MRMSGVYMGFCFKRNFGPFRFHGVVIAIHTEILFSHLLFPCLLDGILLLVWAVYLEFIKSRIWPGFGGQKPGVCANLVAGSL